ncbi:MAG TPA: hypothetical protein DDZ80_05360 [Cyanobacteria bacterium UBA8803]|nr:hypothetical protein [Cyanobacteria bacterium UBA9273]HBL57972.1 hypothetical protein [Cyanobacteria bacterium UBA8803]
MISIPRSALLLLAWFIAGLIGTVLLAAIPSLNETAAAINSNRLEIVQPFTPNTELASSFNPAFEEVAASHLEPNFFQ